MTIRTKKTAILAGAILALVLSSSALAAAAGLPAAYRQALEQGVDTVQPRSSQLLIGAVSRAPVARQSAIVGLLRGLPPEARQRMGLVLDRTLTPLGGIQAQAVADALVGVASAAEQQVVAALAAQSRAVMTSPLPPRLRQAVLSVYARVGPATQLVVMTANRLAASQVPPVALAQFLQSIESLLSLIPPEYAEYGLSLVADLVGLATPADEQRVAELVAYLQSVVRINDLRSSLAAQIHASTMYQGERWACVLGGGRVSDSVSALVGGVRAEASLCLT